MLKPLTVWITTNFGKFFKTWEYQTTWPASWEICMQVKKQQLESDMEQETGSKLGKEYIMAVYCHPAYLTYMQSTSWEMPDWMKHRLESRFLAEMSTTSVKQITPPYGRKRGGAKESLDESERGEWKSGLKLTFKKLRSWHPVPSLHGKQKGKKQKQWQILFSWAPKSLQMVTAAVKLRCLLLGRKAVANLDSILKSRNIILPTMVHIVKAMVFPVVMCGITVGI